MYFRLREAEGSITLIRYTLVKMQVEEEKGHEGATSRIGLSRVGLHTGLVMTHGLDATEPQTSEG